MVPSCLYREAVSVNKPLTLDGGGHAEIRGSDIWTDWTPTGSQWVSVNTVPNFGLDPNGMNFAGQHLEQVFLDGTQLTQVVSYPTPSQFALDGARHVILAVTPAGHTVEVTTRTYWAVGSADSITWTGWTMRHAATLANGHALGNDDHSRWTLENSALADVHGTMVGVGGQGSFETVANSTLTGAGDLAIAGPMANYAVIQGNTITNSGRGGYDWGWQAGGVKLVAGTGQVVTANTVYGNGGPGLWWDIGSSKATVSGNRVHDNVGPQIHFEISDGASIHDNVVWNTLGNTTNVGIYISSSGNVEVYNNTVYDPNAATGIQAIDDNRGDKPATSGMNINIHDNNIVQQIDGTPGLKWWDYGSGTISRSASNNHGTNNHFWYAVPESGAPRFEWGPSSFGSLLSFVQTPGGVGSSYLSDAAKNQLLTSLGIPTPGS